MSPDALSAELYQACFEQIPLPLLLTDSTSSRFLTFNQAALALFGLTQPDVIQTAPIQLFPGLCAFPNEPCQVRVQTVTGVVWQRIQPIPLTGARLWVLQPVEPAQLQSENQRLITLNQRKREELANLAHEIRTPLTAILGWPEILLDLPEAPEPVYQAAHAIEQEAQLVFRLLEDLLALSALEAGQLQLDIRPESLSDLLCQAVEMMRVKIRETHHQIRLSLPAEDLQVPMDPLRIMQVVLNLLNNALKFSPPESTILISAQAQAHEVRVCIQDSGMGLRPEDLERVFERFVRTEEARTIEGSGIGLSLAREFITRHGGVIDVVSRPGEGALFWFSLPLA
jgi:signal transduction histidine kinase